MIKIKQLNNKTISYEVFLIYTIVLSEYGKSAMGAAPNCRAIKTIMPRFPSGNYWIKPPWSQAFLAYCDMETDGGGWTLLWSYTFLKYDNFNNIGNAVTPTPLNIGTNPGIISAIPPQNETDYNAIRFDSWKFIGSEVLLKSNINNWIACTPGVGNFVERIQGSLNCRMIKHQIGLSCFVVPNGFYTGSSKGLMVRGSKAYYYYVTDPADHWPTHDPCGTNAPNHLTNVPDPHGNIYVR